MKKSLLVILLATLITTGCVAASGYSQKENIDMVGGSASYRLIDSNYNIICYTFGSNGIDCMKLD